MGEASAAPHPQARKLPADDAAENSVTSTAAGRFSDRSSDDPRSRTKWLGDIPYDVFFDDPLAVAADERPVSASDRAAAPESAAAGASGTLPDVPDQTVRHAERRPDAVTNPDSTTPNWQQLADITVLNDEVKQLRNRLSANLRTVASYNRGLDAIANDAVVLAALASVVAQHPGSLNWKPHALAVRDLAAELAGYTSRSGREAFSAAGLSFEKILSILDGGPPQVEEAAEPLLDSEVAERSELMKRIKRSFDWLKSEMTSESRIRNAPDQAAREATLLAALGGLVSTESYDYANEPQYQQFVRNFIEGNVGMTAAVTAGDYDSFITARDRVQNACAECHAEYALGDEGL